MTTTETIAAQLRVLGVRANMLVEHDENTLQVHLRKRGKVAAINTHIEYDRNLDLYNVRVYRVFRNGEFDALETPFKSYEGIYADMLGEVIEGKI